MKMLKPYNDKTSQEPDQKNKCCEKCKPLEHIPPYNSPICWKYAGSLELRCERCKQLVKATEYGEYVQAVIK
jgi:hypothetical protein